MEITVNTKNDCCKSVDVNCSPVEWLVILKALRLLSENNDVHPSDRNVADDMLAVEPLFSEMEG